MGVRTSTNEKQLQDLTSKAIKLWLYDLEQNSIDSDCKTYETEEEYNSIGYLGEKTDLFGNPFVLANCVAFLHDGKEIYDELAIPALKELTDVKLKNKNYFDDYRYIEIEYNNQIIRFNILNFWSSKTGEWIDYHSFTFYRPWIVGVHKAQNREELIAYTKQSLLLWFKDLTDEGMI